MVIVQIFFIIGFIDRNYIAFFQALIENQYVVSQTILQNLNVEKVY